VAAAGSLGGEDPVPAHDCAVRGGVGGWGVR